MAWTAVVTDKRWANGILTVNLEYSDGARTFGESMQTRSGQDSDWVAKEVTQRISNLDALDIFSATIVKGLVVPLQVEPDPGTTAKDIYRNKLHNFIAAQQALRMGILTDTHAAFVVLRTWLIDNFDPDYLDLFME